MVTPRTRTARPKPAPKAREYLEGDERRKRLLDVGLESFGAAPYDQVSIDDLAQAAGISRGLLYHYFPTKRDFYAAVVERAATELFERTQTDPSLPLQERARRGLEAYFVYVAEHTAAYAAVMKGGVGSDAGISAIVDRTRSRFLDSFLEALPELQEDKRFRIALRGWIGYVEAVSLSWVENRSVDLATVRDDAMLMLLHVVARFASTPIT